jgi:hypothetical protein
MKHAAIEILLRSIVDYAGTFPPAKLSLAQSVSSYVRYRAGVHAWMLGRFILPAGKLPEFEELAPPVRAGAGTPWPLSLVLSSEAASEIDQIPRFNEKWAGRAEIAAVEIPSLEPSKIGPVVDRLPDAVEAFLEVPIGPNLEATAAAIAAAGASAKIRTGGVIADAFPSSVDLARFMRACLEAKISFKATAGLHHAVRGRYPLTYDPDSPVAQMHGFLNVCVAAAVVRQGEGSDAEEILEESSAQAFRFTPDGIAWRDRIIPAADLDETRRHFFRSFGSCDFQGPAEELMSSRGLSD